MSDDERTCCDCMYESNVRHLALTCRRCKENGGDQDNFEPKLKPPKPVRVDIDATGRKALDLGQSWVWRSGTWEGNGTLRVLMGRKTGGNWDELECECVVPAIEVVYEDA